MKDWIIFEKTSSSRRSARPSSRKCDLLDNVRGGRGHAPIGSSYEDRPATRAEALLDCTLDQYSALAERFSAAWAKQDNSD